MLTKMFHLQELSIWNFMIFSTVSVHLYDTFHVYLLQPSRKVRGPGTEDESETTDRNDCLFQWQDTKYKGKKKFKNIKSI